MANFPDPLVPFSVIPPKPQNDPGPSYQLTPKSWLDGAHCFHFYFEDPMVSNISRVCSKDPKCVVGLLTNVTVSSTIALKLVKNGNRCISRKLDSSCYKKEVGNSPSFLFGGPAFVGHGIETSEGKRETRKKEFASEYLIFPLVFPFFERKKAFEETDRTVRC